ncbi:MAG TPA: hypothetical protein VFE25_14495, partial [Opitutaceae bacterium]|nr:hypothetical protein [Opitutaceae bacterium]
WFQDACTPMRILKPTPRLALILSALLVAVRLSANPVVVFSEKESYDLGSPTQGPSDPDKRTFFEAYRADRSAHPTYETELSLINPPEWGKTISAATRGTIQIHPSFTGGLACRLSLEGLQPDHDYILTLNGNPALPGNELFVSAVPGNPKERYVDFQIVKSDSKGRFEADMGIFLKPGAYKARCYVKDTSDFKIVLYHDYFPFEVK